MNNNTFTNNNITTSSPENETKTDTKKEKFTIFLYHLGGTLALGLAILGIIVPGLPTTPFALLSAALFAKSSPKMYNWLLNNRFLGPRIKDYHRKKGVTRKGKIGIILFMSSMVLLSSFIVGFPLGFIILSLGLIGGIVVWFFVPNAREHLGNTNDADRVRN